MSPAANERWQIRAPLIAVATACWLALLTRRGDHTLVAFCNSEFWTSFSFDRIAFFLAASSPHHLLLEGALMVSATMLPMTAGAFAHVHARSLPQRRPRSIALFAFGYFAVWIVCCVPIVTIVLVIQSIQPGPTVVLFIVGAIALLWQCSPVKQICLNRCHRAPALPVSGFRADLHVFRYGATQGVWCCGACWALMLLPLVMPSSHLLAMGLLGTLVVAERLEKPRHPRWEIRLPTTMLRAVWARLEPGFAKHALPQSYDRSTWSE